MIAFILNNKEITTSEKTGVTLLDFIRENQQLKGTKIGCREGDCGACTILVGTLNKDRIIYESITSCISPLGNAHGKHIVTIEGVNLEENLNTVQKSLADNYATQCGFCTPGFVVSMTGYALNDARSTCTDAISGNICRCTGYKSIEKATLDVKKILTLDKNKDIEHLIDKHFIPSYFKDIPKKLKVLNDRNIKTVNSNGSKVASGTDVYVRNADNLSTENVHLLANIKELKGIYINDDTVFIGANTTVTEIFHKEELNSIFPKLKSFLKLVSSEQIRNMGTIGGNFVNASPIGDMSVFFLALDSTLHLGVSTKRQIPFSEFHLEYKKYDLQENELITGISFKKPTNSKFNFEKVSKRTHLDIASVNTACQIKVTEGVIQKASISIGGVAAIPKLLIKTNQFLLGKPLSMEIIKEAAVILQSEISPISDVRGTTEYKRLLARQLFFAHFLELFPSLHFEKILSVAT